MRFNAERQQFIAQSVQPHGISGLSGKIVSPLFQLTIHGIRRTFQCNTDSRQVERSVASPSRPSFGARFSGILEGSTFRQLGCILRSRLMRRSFKR